MYLYLCVRSAWVEYRERRFAERYHLAGCVIVCVVLSWIRPRLLVTFVVWWPLCYASVYCMQCSVVWFETPIKLHVTTRCWRNGFLQPVWKHGPRSLAWKRALGWQTRARNESECYLNVTKVGTILIYGAPSTGHRLRSKIWVWVFMLGPERWWTMRDQGEARGNPGGGSKGFWRANRSSELRIGAKD